MTGTEKIIGRILQEAEDMAQELTQAARQQAETATARTMQEAKEQEARIVERARREAKEGASRTMAVADLTLRKELLAQKHRVLDEAFDKASQQFANLSDAHFVDIYLKLVLGALQKGSEGIAPAKEDAHRLGESFVAAVNDALVQQGKNAEVVLLPARDGLCGGCVLVSGEMEIDLSVQSVLNNVRESNEGEVAALLFAFMEG